MKEQDAIHSSWTNHRYVGSYGIFSRKQFRKMESFYKRLKGFGFNKRTQNEHSNTKNLSGQDSRVREITLYIFLPCHTASTIYIHSCQGACELAPWKLLKRHVLVWLRGSAQSLRPKDGSHGNGKETTSLKNVLV